MFKATKLLVTETTPPLVLINKEVRENEIYDVKTLERCSFIRRKNPSRHCRAFIIVQPEMSKSVLSISDQNSSSLWNQIYSEIYWLIFFSGFCIQQNYGPQYILWITTTPIETFQNILEEIVINDENYYSDQEFLLGTFGFEGMKDWKNDHSKSLQIHYFNRYYENTTRKWLPFLCKLDHESKRLNMSQSAFPC